MVAMMVARVAVWAAGKVGWRNPVPSEPQGARRSSAALAEVFVSDSVRGRNGTDLVSKNISYHITTHRRHISLRIETILLHSRKWGRRP